MFWYSIYYSNFSSNIYKKEENIHSNEFRDFLCRDLFHQWTNEVSIFWNVDVCVNLSEKWKKYVKECLRHEHEE